MHRILRHVPALVGLSLVVAAGCADRDGLTDPDGGSITGSAGSSVTGAAGATGVAGTKGPTGSAGVNGTGKAGTTGTTGTAGTNGKAGTGGTMCGPVCAIYCQFGNVTDGNGCPTCKCNPAPMCKVEECGPVAGGGNAGAALPAPTCSGKVAPPTCARDATGKCGWTQPACACDAIAPCPILCPYGLKVDPMTSCQACECNPAPPACTKNDCGSLPPADYTMKCPDGSVIGPVCERTSNVTCGWTFPKCPPVACPTIACLRACPYGERVDANGCGTCDCIEPKECGALGDWKSCTADMRCTWLQPGCGTPALSTPGCFAREDVGCQGMCSNGRTCLKRVINPCYNPGAGTSCDACGQIQTVCL